MSWLEASAYAPPERANGMRLPPRIAAWRSSVTGPLSIRRRSSVPVPGTVRSMSDRYQQFADSRPGRLVVRRLGLPEPAPLRRHAPGQPLLAGPALLGVAPGGRLGAAAAARARRGRRGGVGARPGRARRGQGRRAPRPRPRRRGRPARRPDPGRVRHRAQRGPARRLRARPRPHPPARPERAPARARHAAGGRRRRARGRGPARAGGLRALRGQGAAGRRHGAARARRPRRRGRGRVDAALPALRPAPPTSRAR